MFPVGREKECENITRFLADTISGRKNKILVVVGNTGCGKTSSLTSISQCFSTLEGRVMFHDLLRPTSTTSSQTNNNNTNTSNDNNRKSKSTSHHSVTETNKSKTKSNNSRKRDSNIHFVNDDNDAGAAPLRLPRLEYIHCAGKSSKFLLAEMIDRIAQPTSNGGFFAANVAPNSSSKRNNQGSTNRSSSSSNTSGSTNKKERERHQQALEEEKKRTQTALSSSFEKLEGRFVEQLVTESAIGGVTNNYISGQGSVVEDYKKLMKKRALTKMFDSTTSTVDQDQQEQEEENTKELLRKAQDFDKSNKPPFCFLVLDEIDTPGGGWRDSQFRSVMNQALSIKSIGVILIANKTGLKWLTDNMTEYVTFGSYGDKALADIARQKMLKQKQEAQEAKLEKQEKQDQKADNDNKNSKKNKGSKAAATTKNKNEGDDEDEQKDDDEGITFHPKALEFAAKSVAAHAGGDARRMIDHCRAAEAEKWIKNNNSKQEKEKREKEEKAEKEKEKKLLEEKRSREKMEKSAPTTTTTTTRRTVLGASSRKSSARLSEDSAPPPPAPLPAGSYSTRSTIQSVRDSTDSATTTTTKVPVPPPPQQPEPTTTANSKKKNNNDSKNTSDSMITMSDVAAVIRSSNSHPGIEMIPALPHHALLALCCIVNSIKKKFVEEQQRRTEQQTTIAFTGGRSANYHNNNNNKNSEDNLSFNLNEMFEKYQALCRQLNITTSNLGNFRDTIGALVDVQLVSDPRSQPKSSGNSFTLTVHTNEIESVLKNLGAMYEIADGVVRRM